jgi:acyl-CoA thioesterase
MRVTDTMTNGHGTVHGGYLFLLADAAFAYACNSYGPVAVAHSAQVTFIRPATIHDELLAAAVERARYGRNGIYDVTVRRAPDDVIAEFRGHCTLLSGNPTAPPVVPDS